MPLGLKASIAIKNTLRTIDSQNVVAKLEGSDPKLKDEYVVYSAHWDHLGVGAPVNGDKIYNGALDNASGVATVLEIARAFTQIQPQPKRSILFLMVTAEEQGLLGSQYYATTPLYPLNKTVANINIDGVNQWGRTKDLTVIGMGASDLDDYLKAAADEQGRVLRPDPEPEKGFYYRSDHFNFAKQGVPALDPDAGIDFVGKDRRLRKGEAGRVHREGLPRAVRPDKARLGSQRRGRRRAVVVRGRLPRRQCRQDSGVEAGQRVQGEARRIVEEVTPRCGFGTNGQSTCHIPNI